MSFDNFTIIDIVPNTGDNTTTSFSLNQIQKFDSSVSAFLNKCGRNWKDGILNKEISTLARVHHKNNVKGNFFTLIWNWKNKDEAKKYLELNDNIKVSIKSKFCIKPGCLIAVGQFLNNENFQIYVQDKSHIVKIDNSIKL